MPSTITTTLRSSFEQQGYCHAAYFDAETIQQIDACCQQVIAETSVEHQEKFKSQGSLIDVSNYPAFSTILGNSRLVELFEDLGFADPRFSSGSVISKPSAGPALFWHQDWWAWDEDWSYTNTVPQFNVMIYLTETRIENGCLRVIPGSHRQRHPIHEIAVDDFTPLCQAKDPDHPLYQSWSQERSVPVRPGDVIVKDSRLLHGAYPNQSDERRTLLSLNFMPDYAALSPSMKARAYAIFSRHYHADGDAEVMNLSTWPPPARRRIAHLCPDPPDEASAAPFCQVPDVERMTQMDFTE